MSKYDSLEELKHSKVEPLTLEGSENPLTQIVKKVNEIIKCLKTLPDCKEKYCRNEIYKDGVCRKHHNG